MINHKENIVYSWVAFILFPFAMFIYAIKNFNKRNSQNLILAFSFLFGYSVFLYSGDILRYESAFIEIFSYTWDDYFYLLKGTLTLSTEKDVNYSINALTRTPDIFGLSLSFIISRFTDNPRWFWAFLSLIYTFLILKFFDKIYYETYWVKNSLVQKTFLVGLAFIVPFYVGVSGVRFWPALFLFTIYALKFSHHKKLKYLIFAAMSVLIHYSFIVPFMLLIISMLIPKKRIIYRILIIGGLFIFATSTITSSLNIIKNVSSKFEGTSIEDSTDSYTSEEVIEDKNDRVSNSNWYVSLRVDAMLYFLILLGVIDALGLFRFKENQFLRTTYPLVLTFLILTIVTMDLASISRFRYVFFLLILSRYVALVGLQPLNNSLKLISYLFLPILTLYIIVSLRAGFYFVDPILLISNSILTFFIHSDVSLSEFLVGH